MGFAHANTSVFRPPVQDLSPLPGRSRQARGFTLLELVAVVTIIAIVAALAMPSIASRLRDRRTQQTAQAIAQLYSTARMRAMGRGAAVLVRYNNNQFEVREAIRGAAAETDVNCQPLPISTCLAPGQWGLGADAPNRLITTYDPQEFEGVRMEMKMGSTDLSAMDVCFTPMGRAFFSNTAGGALSQLVGVPQAEVRRVEGSQTIGLKRVVVIMPNGNSHLGTAQ